MGKLFCGVKRSELKAGDHIYTWRACYTYSHHGIYVGHHKVVHFTNNEKTSSSFISSSSKLQPPSTCPNLPDCGFRQPDSGVVLSCLGCFLDKGSLYRFEYGVSVLVFLAKVRGGTCTTACSDPPATVIHRAMYLLHNGFGNYDLFKNNCEDFAIYCKTGLLIIDDEREMGRIGQALGIPLTGVLMAVNVWMGTVAAGIYFGGRYSADIGVRKDVVKVAVEDLAVKLGGKHSQKNYSVRGLDLIHPGSS